MLIENSYHDKNILLCVAGNNNAAHFMCEIEILNIGNCDFYFRSIQKIIMTPNV